MPDSSLHTASRQRGVTLTELMIALVLASLVVLAATAMVVTSRATYRTQDENTRLAESARFGLELTNRLVRLAGYTNFGDDLGSPPASYTPDPAWILTKDAYSMEGPNIVGANALKPTVGATINGSDSLTIRYFGSGTGAVADGSILDCAGFGVPQPVIPPPPPPPDLPANVEKVYRDARAYNVLFVDLDVDGEPALKCRRQTFDPVTGIPSGLPGDTQTLIRGVESFQVLYGEALYPVSPPNDPDSVAPQSLVYRTGIGGPNPVTNWNNVMTVRIALLLRSATGARPDPDTTTYDLFGPDYPRGGDAGTRIDPSAMSASERTRARRIVETTVFVRNRVALWPSLSP